MLRTAPFAAPFNVGLANLRRSFDENEILPDSGSAMGDFLLRLLRLGYRAELDFTFELNVFGYRKKR